MNALIIEDSRTERRLIARVLTGAGFNVDDTGSAEEALDLLKNADVPNLIVIDWVLPGMSGLEFVRTIKNDPKYAETRILVVSIRQERQDVREMLAAGADDYIFKPVDARALENRLPVLGF
jgi:two-component system, chemotaxis family, chemotaxis protein CheY